MAITVLQPKGVSKPLGMYSHGMEANGLVVVAGQVGMKPDGGLAGTDAGSQTKQALANIAAVLGAAGCATSSDCRLSSPTPTTFRRSWRRARRYFRCTSPTAGTRPIRCS